MKNNISKLTDKAFESFFVTIVKINSSKRMNKFMPAKSNGMNMAEYALIGVLVALVALAAFTNLGSNIAAKVGEVAGAI